MERIKAISQQHGKFRTIALLTSLVVLFIAIRSIHFAQSIDFSTDQANFSIHALHLFRQKQISLIGPEISFNLSGRQLYQSSSSYYLTLVFLLLGHFDPLSTTFSFVVFSALMIIPLYYGVKFLANTKSALLVCLLYCLLPYYITYTKFLWNANFQFALAPGLIYLMGLYKKHQSSNLLFAIGFYMGILLQIHYELIPLTLILLGFYGMTATRKIIGFLTIGAGFLVGFLPVILFEIKNDLYNIKTAFLYLTHINQVVNRGSASNNLARHYFLTTSLILLVVLAYLLRTRIRTGYLLITMVVLIAFDTFLYLPTPTHAYGMPEHWNFPAEAKVNQIIESQHLSNYNIVNLSYDTLAKVQKYLLEKDNITINNDDYRTNKYLYVVNNDDRYLENPAYEVNTFQPSIEINHWSINYYYTLYLLERL